MKFLNWYCIGVGLLVWLYPNQDWNGAYIVLTVGLQYYSRITSTGILKEYHCSFSTEIPDLDLH